jgi:transcriptional regulator with XRE-family HTH domain
VTLRRSRQWKRPTEGRRLLALALERAGLSQADLAARLGVTQPAISRYLAAERMPTLELALALQRELGIPSDSWARAPHRKAS